jgi:hypothetical protein
MSGQTVRFLRGPGLVAAVLLIASPALAGEHVRAGKQSVAPAQAPAPVVRVVPSVTISLVALPPAQAASEAASINLRGPDGQLRRFPVEGGAAELASRVIVLRPGQSLTILYLPERK